MDKNEKDNLEKACRFILSHKNLSDEMEKIKPGIKATLAGYLCSFWFPRDISRRIIMVIIATASFAGYFIYNQKWFLLLLLILPIFSPRIVGETLYCLGWCSRAYNKGYHSQDDVKK